MDQDNSVDSAALEKILGDMDDMESNRVYGDKPTPAEGVSITIDVAPKKGDEPKKEDDQHDEAECLANGGCVKHMSKGGMVDDDEMKMPPFLRKRK